MTYRKSKSGSEFVRIKDSSGVTLSVMFFPKTNPRSCRLQYSDNIHLAEDAANGDVFGDCTQREFEQAYARAMKMIEI